MNYCFDKDQKILINSKNVFDLIAYLAPLILVAYLALLTLSCRGGRVVGGEGGV